MRHLIIRQRTQRLFLFFILAVSLYFTFKSRVVDRGQGFQFDSLTEKRVAWKEGFSAKDKTIKEIPLTGYINPLQKRANFVIENDVGKIFINLAHPSHKKLFIKSRLENVNFKRSKISADVLIVADLKERFEGGGGLSVWALVKNLKVDQNKLLDISSRFKLIEDKLKIESLKFGDSYILKGVVGLTPPNLVELNFKISRANIRDLAIIAMVKDPGFIYGIMEGEFFIKGPINSVVSKGRLTGKNGRIGPVTYDFANINFEGFGPILRIVDSRVRQAQGTMALEGLLDLRNIGKKNLYDSIRVNADELSYAWNGWNITKNGARELEIRRDVGEEFKVGLKTFAQDGLSPYYGDREYEVRLEYKMGDELFKMELKEDEEFFGVERSLKF